MLTCAECGKKNKIRPSAKGSPHCGSCGKPLPWLVNATDATFPFEARSSVAVLVDLWAPWCGPCRVVGPQLEALSKDGVGGELRGKDLQCDGAVQAGVLCPVDLSHPPGPDGLQDLEGAESSS